MDDIKNFGDPGRDNRMDRRTFVGRTSLLAGVAFGFPVLTGRELFGQEPVPGATIDTASGKLRGTVHNGIHAFKGIPYGHRLLGRTVSWLL